MVKTLRLLICLCTFYHPLKAQILFHEKEIGTYLKNPFREKPVFVHFPVTNTFSLLIPSPGIHFRLITVENRFWNTGFQPQLQAGRLRIKTGLQESFQPFPLFLFKKLSVNSVRRYTPKFFIRQQKQETQMLPVRRIYVQVDSALPEQEKLILIEDVTVSINPVQNNTPTNHARTADSGLNAHIGNKQNSTTGTDSAGFKTPKRKTTARTETQIQGNFDFSQQAEMPAQIRGSGGIQFNGSWKTRGKIYWKPEVRIAFSCWWIYPVYFLPRDDHFRLSLSLCRDLVKFFGFHVQTGLSSRMFPEIPDPEMSPAPFPSFLAPGFFHTDAGLHLEAGEKFVMETGLISGRIGFIAFPGGNPEDPNWPQAFSSGRTWIFEHGFSVRLQSSWKFQSFHFKMEWECRFDYHQQYWTCRGGFKAGVSVGSRLEFRLQQNSHLDQSIDSYWRHYANLGFSWTI